VSSKDVVSSREKNYLTAELHIQCLQQIHLFRGLFTELCRAYSHMNHHLRCLSILCAFRAISRP
jgi:hypothetical protein